MTIALVLGCGECVWDDAKRALSMFTPDAVIAVKDMIAKWPGKIDHAAALHPDRVPGYLRERQRQKFPKNDKLRVWAHKHLNKVVTDVTEDWAGSSGLFGVKVALQLGFTGVVLVGVPMDRKQGHVARKKEWINVTLYFNGWRKHLPELRPRVRSMSGWTKIQLGEPTPDWLVQMSSAPPSPEWAGLLRRKGDAQIESDAGKSGRASRASA